MIYIQMSDNTSDLETSHTFIKLLLVIFSAFVIANFINDSVVTVDFLFGLRAEWGVGGLK